MHAHLSPYIDRIQRLKTDKILIFKDKIILNVTAECHRHLCTPAPDALTHLLKFFFYLVHATEFLVNYGYSYAAEE